MKLKGHCKIELTDKKTGKVESYEEHNMITEFSQELFKQMGYLRPNAFANRESLPIDDLFGGVMLFNQAITEQTDMTGRHSSPLFPPADKEMVANASMAITGNTAPEEMGQYNTRSSTSTATSRKFIFDWDTDEALGDIACVCLTSKYGGYKGVGNSYSNTRDTSIRASEPMEAPLNQHDVTTGKATATQRVAYINRSTNVVGVVQGLDPATGVLNIREYDLSGVAINPMKNMANIDGTTARVIRTINYTFTPCTFTSQGRWFTFSRYGYWGIVITSKDPNADDNSATVIKFNLDNTQEQYTFNNLKMGYLNGNSTQYARYHFAFLGNYFICACWGNIYPSNNFCYAIHTGTYEKTSLGVLDSSNESFGAGAVLEGRFYIGHYVIRLKNGQPVLEKCNGNNVGVQIANGDGFWCGGQAVDDPYILWNGTNDMAFGVAGTLMRPYLATIFNLDSPVHKLSDKTLKVTYELTLVTE
jgi:hypothetical protein